jgi:hypothetical protein
VNAHRNIVVEPAMTRSAPGVRLGRAVLDTERGVLRCADGTVTALRPKTLDLTLLMARHAGRLVRSSTPSGAR